MLDERDAVAGEAREHEAAVFREARRAGQDVGGRVDVVAGGEGGLLRSMSIFMSEFVSCENSTLLPERTPAGFSVTCKESRNRFISWVIPLRDAAVRT